MSEPHFPQVIAHRYRIINQIGAGGMGAVYRAYDRLTGLTVALKRVTAPSQDRLSDSRTLPSAATDVMLGFAMEFRTLAGLRHPNIVSVLDYGFDQGRQPFFTMQLIEGGRPLTKAADGLGMRGKVNLLVGTLQALAYLHRRGVIHRDLKPANVLVTPDSVAKVMDFGLALNLSQSSQTPFTGVVGTITYMAPELLSSNQASIQSDLWAIGVMAYEMFVGRHPFNTRNVGSLVQSLMHDKPDVSSLPDELGAVLKRLLARFPERRYDHADAAIAALRRAVGMKPLGEDTHVRESFLQAAAFVGRDAELRALLDGLNSATRPAIAAVVDVSPTTSDDSTTELPVIDPDAPREAETTAEAEPEAAPEPPTHFWLVGGESGVGKSRLLDEVRTRALVSGILVLRGQAVEGGGLPYQMWREPLRRLALSADLSDLEAGILKALIPDISALLERAIPDVQPLEGRADAHRLSITVAQVMARQSIPILVILEDLQWAFESSAGDDDPPAALAMLRATLLACEGAPTESAPRLMIVGTYRDDDAPDLPARLNPPGEPALREVRTMKLGRLDAAAIGSLTASMLGAAGGQPSLVSFLQRETEGNALFLVEVVRALAEQAGRLSNVIDMTLPQHLFAGGVRHVVKRRLARVPEAHQDLLKFAAVAGRQLDLRVLGAQHAALTRQADHGRAEKSISGRIVRHTTLDPFLTACADAAVIEIFDGEWRFAHDKIREAVQEDLPSDALAALHRRVAETIEQVYSADDARIDHLDVLLAHWTEAGSAERQVYYIVLAARRLIDLSAQYNRALLLLQRAEVLARTHPYLEASLVALLNLLGDTYRNHGSYPEAADHYARALALAESTGDRPGEAAALRGLGVVARWQGDTAAAVTYTEQAMALFRALNDLSGIARCLNTLGNIARSQGNFAQARDCFTWSLALRREAGDKRGIAASLFHLGTFAYYEGDNAAALDYFTQSLRLREEIGDRQGIAASLRSLGNAADSQRDHTLARQYFAQALDIQREIDDRPGIAASLFSLGGVAYRQGDHDAARDYFTQSLTLRRDIGDRQGQITTLLHRAAAYTAHDAHDEAERDLIECLLVARELDAQSQMVEGLAVYAGLLLARGEARLAAEIAGLAEAHPALTAYAREQWLRPLLDGLRAALPDVELDGAMRAGAGRSMGDMLGALLARAAATPEW